MAAKGIFYIQAYVSDFDRSKKFYGEVLGWKLNTDLPEVAGFFFGAGYLILLSDTRSEASRIYAGGMNVEVQVEDLSGEHARLRDLGVEVSDISHKPWGERKFSFVDPDGYPWSYGQPT